MIEALDACLPGEWHEATVPGPYGDPVTASWWTFQPPAAEGATGPWAVVEMARASGITLSDQRDPEIATSAGTGALIAAAFKAGASRVFVGAGGSATVDGGAGALRALGARLLDDEGQPAPEGGGGLAQVAQIVPPADVGPITVLCDVHNPWLGPEGAPAVFGPQKGADPAMVIRLERGLDHFGGRLAAATGRDPRALARAGAAGGLAGGLWAGVGAELVSGLDAVAALTGLDEAIAQAALIITGEGQVDAQTAMGKVAAGVVARALNGEGGRPRPVWIIGGAITPEAEEWAAELPVALIPIPAGPIPLEECMRDASALLSRAAVRAARLWSLGDRR